jgi:hypothetical protein
MLIVGCNVLVLLALAGLADEPAEASSKAVPRQTARLKKGSRFEGRFAGSTPKDLKFILHESPAGGSTTELDIGAIESLSTPAQPFFGHAARPRRSIRLKGEQWITAAAAWSGVVHNAAPNALGAPAAGGGAPLTVEEIFGSPLGRPIEIPISAVEAVLQPTGEWNLLYLDFETQPPGEFAGYLAKPRLSALRSRSGKGSLSLPAAAGAPNPGKPGEPASAWKLPLDPPLDAGRAEVSFHVAPRQSADDEAIIGFTFGTPPDSQRLNVTVGSAEGAYAVSRPVPEGLKSYTVERSAGWHALTLIFDEDRTLVVMDQSVLAAGPALQGALTAIEFATLPAARPAGRVTKERAAKDRGTKESTTKDSDQFFSVDDLQIVARAPVRAVPVNTQPGDKQPGDARSADLLWLTGGDELYGRIDGFDDQAVRFTNRQDLKIGDGSRGKSVAWKEAAGIVFERRPTPAAPAVDGYLCTIVGVHDIGLPLLEPDRLLAAVQSATDEALIADHPWLGRLTISWNRIARVIPHYRGTMILVDASRHHLGDEVCADFLVPLPEGTKIEHTVTLERPPAGNAYLALSAAELEPAPSATARKSAAESAAESIAGRESRQGPRLGFYPTRVYINDKLAGELNREIRLRAAVANPQRLRMKIDARFWKAGENRIRFEQITRPQFGMTQPELNKKSPPNKGAHLAELDGGDLNDRDFDDFEYSRLAIEIEN